MDRGVRERPLPARQRALRRADAERDGPTPTATAHVRKLRAASLPRRRRSCGGDGARFEFRTPVRGAGPAFRLAALHRERFLRPTIGNTTIPDWDLSELE